MDKNVYDDCHRRTKTVLVQHKYRGYCYKIVTHGTHPTAYIMIPNKHKLFNVSYDDIHISVHGGLTYSSHESDGHYWIGWDYAHAGDFYNSPVGPSKGKMWSLSEIQQHCHDAINQIILLKKFKKPSEYYYGLTECD